MYSPSPFAQRSVAGAYRQMHIHTGVEGASPHRLVAMLFDGLLECLAQASGAIRDRDLALKSRAIGRAVRIVEEGLKGGLDRSQGGALADQLAQLYGYITLRLTQANARDDAAALAECKRLVEPLQQAWLQIGERVEPPNRA